MIICEYVSSRHKCTIFNNIKKLRNQDWKNITHLGYPFLGRQYICTLLVMNLKVYKECLKGKRKPRDSTNSTEILWVASMYGLFTSETKTKEKYFETLSTIRHSDLILMYLNFMRTNQVGLISISNL